MLADNHTRVDHNKTNKAQASRFKWNIFEREKLGIKYICYKQTMVKNNKNQETSMMNTFLKLMGKLMVNSQKRYFLSQENSIYIFN